MISENNIDYLNKFIDSDLIEKVRYKYFCDKDIINLYDQIAELEVYYQDLISYVFDTNDIEEYKTTIKVLMTNIRHRNRQFDRFANWFKFASRCFDRYLCKFTLTCDDDMYCITFYDDDENVFFVEAKTYLMLIEKFEKKLFKNKDQKLLKQMNRAIPMTADDKFYYKGHFYHKDQEIII